MSERPLDRWTLRRRLLLAFLLVAGVASSGGVASAIALRDMTLAYHDSHAEFSAHEPLHEDQIRVLDLALALRDRPSDGRDRLAALLAELEREGEGCPACHEAALLRPGVELRARLRERIDALATTAPVEGQALEPTLRELARLRARHEHDVHELLEAREHRSRAILDSFWLRQLVWASTGLLLALAFTPWLVRTIARSTLPLIAARAAGEAAPPRPDPDLAPVAAALDEMAGRISAQAESEARKQLLDRALSAQEEERRRVARELHDDVGQQLLALLVELRQGLPADQRRGLEARLVDVSASVYRMAKDLRPPVLDDLGLALALPALAEEIAGRSGMAVLVETVGLDGPAARLPSGIETVRYRIAQEALSNVVRHAGASRIDLAVTRRPDAVTMFVEDDGRGFDVEVTRRRPSSLGLSGMSERATLAGGALTIESTPGRGTVVRVQIPLGGAA